MDSSGVRQGVVGTTEEGRPVTRWEKVISTGTMALKVERMGWILRNESGMDGDWGIPGYVRVEGKKQVRDIPNF